MLGNKLSRAHASVNILEVLKLDIDEIVNHYEEKKFYGPVLEPMKGEEVPDEIMKRKIVKLLTFFPLVDGKIMYEEKSCLPRKAVFEVMHLAHDA